MGKKKMLLFIIILLLIIISASLVILKMNKKKDVVFEKKFKEEYESLNGKETGKEGKKYLDISIDSKNGAIYIDSKQTLDLLKNGTGIIYFGFPECPWCRNLVPVLVDAVKDTDYKEFYYANLLDERDQLHLEDGNVVTDKKGSDTYYRIVEQLKNHLGVYEGLEDDTIKRLYFPTVVFVKDGKVVDLHVGTLDGQEDPYKELSEKEKSELKNILITGIKKVEGSLCTSDSKC